MREKEMSKPSRNYWMVEKVEAMRRARNAKFYAKAHGLSELSAARFMDSCREYVQAAREYNRKMILAGINS
jgi:hypothetical protein